MACNDLSTDDVPETERIRTFFFIWNDEMHAEQCSAPSNGNMIRYGILISLQR